MSGVQQVLSPSCDASKHDVAVRVDAEFVVRSAGVDERWQAPETRISSRTTRSRATDERPGGRSASPDVYPSQGIRHVALFRNCRFLIFITSPLKSGRKAL